MPITAPVLVNSWESSHARAIPKSVTFTVPSVARRMLPGFDVAMHQTGPMSGGERRGHLGADLGGPAGKQGALAAKDISQAAAIDQFHDDEIGVAGLAPVVDPDDVGVGQVGGGLGLAPEALDEGFVVGELGVEDLDGHFPAKQGVLAQIDVGHPAAGQVRREVITLGEGVRKVHGEPTAILGEGRLHQPPPGGATPVSSGSTTR